MSVRRLVLHHLDPAVPRPGGIDRCVRGLVRFGPEGTRFGFVGAQDGAEPRHREWQRDTVAGTCCVAPVLRVSGLASARGLPDVARFSAGCLRYGLRIRACRPDIVQVHRPEMVKIARLLFPNAALDYFVHEDAANWSGATTESRWRHVRSSYLRLQVAAARDCDRIVSFSSSAADRLASHCSEVLVQPTWYDPEAFSPAPAVAALPGSVLWIGRLEAVKDPLLAIDVVECLPAEFHLTIVGGGRLSSRVEDEIERRGLAQRVTTFGPAAAADVPDLMRRHAVGMMTSHSEGFPRTLLEMLALGRPVVSTMEADTGRLLDGNRNGVAVEGRDPALLALGIQRFAETVDVHACSDSVRHLAAPGVVSRILE